MIPVQIHRLAIIIGESSPRLARIMLRAERASHEDFDWVLKESVRVLHPHSSWVTPMKVTEILIGVFGREYQGEERFLPRDLMEPSELRLLELEGRDDKVIDLERTLLRRLRVCVLAAWHAADEKPK